MRARVMVAALIALAPGAGADALMVDDLPPESVFTVQAIRVEGNEAVSDRAIRGIMLTKTPPWYKPWRKKDQLNPDLLRTDLQRVETYLRESGYYEARVAHELEVEGDKIRIILHVEEGAGSTVSDVALEAVDFSLTDADDTELRRLITLQAGDVFTQTAYDESRARVERHFLEHGYAYAAVEKRAVVDVGEDAVRVIYSITRGPPAVFGATEVSGAVRVAERLVRREITYRPGDVYDPRKVEQTQASVFGLRLFRSVTVKPANLPAQSGVVDVAITLVEGPRRELKAGVGYGLEDELRGQLLWRHNDFFGGGRQLGFRLKASSIAQAFEGEFRQPYFLHPRQTFVLPVTQVREEEPGFTVARVQLAPRVERRLGSALKLALGYNVEYDDLSDVSDAVITRLDEFRASGYVSSVTALLERNTTIDLLDPREGSVVNVSLEQAGALWQGDYTFYRGIIEAKKYVPVLATRVLAGRFRIGAGDGFGDSRDLPVFRRFFAGGISSTRGYDRHRLGPLAGSSHSPVGGRSLLEANLEFRTPLYKKIGGVVFFDVGEVRRRPASYTLGDLQYGVGVGVRYGTIVGPLRVDFGVPLQAPPGEPSWQIHFSIGQAF